MLVPRERGSIMLHHFEHLAPDFALAWAGWLIHSFVHSTTHRAGQLVRALVRRKR